MCSFDFYAAQLSFSTTYISSNIKHITGKTASQIIDSYVIMEAKSLLINSNMNVQQVSDYLNFPSQSFFGKYFKRLVGISPKVYKNRGELIDTPLTT